MIFYHVGTNRILSIRCTFSITYGNKRLGMDYERAMFGMKISDVRATEPGGHVSMWLGMATISVCFGFNLGSSGKFMEFHGVKPR